ncbi:hypothetical protein [Magnetospirillum sp. 15-1]|uniref:hypothetical protein n=1 Tax=Magnetospirillum sp. 15-1 TaxID=1979370 RepID=UPI0011435AB3|nr:hypothetical protein [Magnetospirillum sp. 15-1]
MVIPHWLESLTEAHPDAVKQTLSPDLQEELDAIVGPEGFPTFLQDLSHAPAAVANLFVPCLRTWLETNSRRLRKNENESVALSRLRHVIKILLAHDDDAGSYIQGIAADNLSGRKKVPFMLLWLSLLMRLDPDAGTPLSSICV